MVALTGASQAAGRRPLAERSRQPERSASEARAVPPSAASLSSGGLARPKDGRIAKKGGPRGLDERARRQVRNEECPPTLKLRRDLAEAGLIGFVEPAKAGARTEHLMPLLTSRSTQ